MADRDDLLANRTQDEMDTAMILFEMAGNSQGATAAPTFDHPANPFRREVLRSIGNIKASALSKSTCYQPADQEVSNNFNLPSSSRDIPIIKPSVSSVSAPTTVLPDALRFIESLEEKRDIPLDEIASRTSPAKVLSRLAVTSPSLLLVKGQDVPKQHHVELSQVVRSSRKCLNVNGISLDVHFRILRDRQSQASEP